MAVRETEFEARERKKREEEAEKRNPFLKMGLGDLCREKDRQCLRLGKYILCDNVMQVPEVFRDEFDRYQSIVEEINRRYPKPGSIEYHVRDGRNSI